MRVAPALRFSVPLLANGGVPGVAVMGCDDWMSNVPLLWMATPSTRRPFAAAVKRIVPLFASARLSVEGPLVPGMVTVTPLSKVSAPLPSIVPPLHVAGPLTVRLPLPVSVPALSASEGREPSELRATLPPATSMRLPLHVPVTVVCPPLNRNLPVPASVPATLCVPPLKSTVLPSPLAVKVPLCVPLPPSERMALVETWPLLFIGALMVAPAPALTVPWLSIVPEPEIALFTLSVPAFCSVRPLSVTAPLMLKVFDEGFAVVPLPLIVPPDQLPPLVSVSVPLPPSVPPFMLKASAAAAALSVAVPPVTLSVATLIGTPTVAVAPLKRSVPLPPMEPPPLTVCVPAPKASVPGAVAVREPVYAPPPESVRTLLVVIAPAPLTIAPMLQSAAVVSVPLLAIVPLPATLALSVSVPSFWSVRPPSVTGAVTPSAA